MEQPPPDSVALHLQRLTGDHYDAAAVAGPGEVLTADEPFPFRLEVSALLRRPGRG